MILVFNPNIDIIHLDEGWHIFEMSQGTSFQISAVDEFIIYVINELNSNDLERSELIDKLLVHGYDKIDVDKGISDLISLGLITESSSTKNRKESIHDQITWFRYWDLRKNTTKLDYSQPNTLDVDKNIMEDYLSEPAPSISKSIKSQKRTLKLSHPAYGKKSDNYSKISHFLFYSFGRLRKANFLEILPCQFKAIPSKGARHPFEAYLLSPGSDSISEGFYHYDVPSHGLKYINEYSGELTHHKSFRIIVTSIYERYQWRYRHSLAYKDLYLELGHLSESMRQIALYYDLRLINIDPLDLPTNKFLKEESVLSFDFFL